MNDEEKETMNLVKTGIALMHAALLVTIALAVAPMSYAHAQSGHMHAALAQQRELSPEQGQLLSIVREATERFKNVNVAQSEQYNLLFGCVTGPDSGAMGLHFVKQEYLTKPPMLANGEIDPTRPEIVIYEPVQGGGLRLIGADYLLFADAWDKAHPGNPPQLMGQLFHYFEAPNRFGLPPFYTLHVWAWKENPKGAFVNWHPDVSCKAFSGQIP